MFAAATPFPWIFALLTGTTNDYCLRLHEQYGEVVKLAPNLLSYASAKAWKDIYERRAGHALLEKEPNFYVHPGDGVPSIVTASHSMHGRMRRLFSHAFSERALREQEPLIRSYVDVMIDSLYADAKLGKSVDLVAYFNWTTFDIIGDLTFGESFNCLDQREYHPWVETLFANVKLPTFFSAAQFFPGLSGLIMALLPKSLKDDFRSNFDYTTEKVHGRIKKSTDRVDFMTRVLEHNDENGMTLPEIESTTNHIIAGGAETTATALSGGMFYLLKKPETLQKLTREIRQSFNSEDEITLAKLADLSYLTATVNEILRVYPPFTGGFPRITPPRGEVILGRYVPGGVSTPPGRRMRVVRRR